ncbi:MAG: hypothetical protein C5S44_11960 [Candidatus Methanocomedens sp.]|nr:MAG: hypothetical protein C5S44_11960 [ANME-2 cluster archaeon]
MKRWQKLAGVIPSNSLSNFTLQTMFDLLITLANRQLSDITSRYALRAVDLKDMVVIDLWNAGEERPVETLIRRRVIPGQPGAGPGTVRTEQRALKAGIPVFGRGLWHTGQ